MDDALFWQITFIEQIETDLLLTFDLLQLSCPSASFNFCFPAKKQTTTDDIFKLLYLTEPVLVRVYHCPSAKMNQLLIKTIIQSYQDKIHDSRDRLYSLNVDVEEERK